MKKKIGSLNALLLLLFMLLLGNSCMAYEYTEQYDFRSGDIYNIFTHQRDLSINNLVTGSSTYNSITNHWNNATTGINNVTNWETLCETLNITLRDYFIKSGEFFGYNSTEMDDNNLWILVSPASYYNSGTTQLRIHFIPNVSVVITSTEYTNQAGLYRTLTNNFYLYNSQGTAVSTSPLSYSTAPVVTLLINTNGTWQIGYRDSNLFSGFANVGDFYQYSESPATDSMWIFNRSLLAPYRDIYYTTPHRISYLPYGSSIYLNKISENRYNLNTKQFSSGEYIEPTPTPQPTSSGDGGGITQQEIEGAIENYWGNKNDLSGEEQKEIIGQAIENINNTISGELANQEAYNMIHNAEEQFKGLFKSPNDFRIYWNDIKYQNKTLINSGEINFTELEDTIPAVGMLMTYIRIILGFTITYNLIKTAWNLLMETLGIKEAMEEYTKGNSDEQIGGE